MTTQIFDPGLQPERTQLSWRRTALSVAVGSAVSFRILPAAFDDFVWFAPGVLGIVMSAWIWWVSARRYRAFTAQLNHRTEPHVPAGTPLLMVAAFSVMVALFAAVTLVLLTVQNA